jgi:hypothetical protein
MRDDIVPGDVLPDYELFAEYRDTDESVLLAVSSQTLSGAPHD